MRVLAGVPISSHPIFPTSPSPVHDAMPSFFDFQLGSDSHVPETESLRYGRFRALQVPKRSVGELFSAFGLHADDLRTQRWTGGGYSYGSISITTTTRGDVEESEEGEGERWWLDKMLISPRRRRVMKLVDQWWGRLGLLVVLPAAIVSPMFFFRCRCLSWWLMYCFLGRRVVRHSVPDISHPRRRRFDPARPV